MEGDTGAVSTYLCEVCGKTEELTVGDALDSGWDYPPFIGHWGIVSARTCGDCGIQDTAWWFLTVANNRTDIAEGRIAVPDNHLRTIERIAKEQA